jgi:hypothetical protein
VGVQSIPGETVTDRMRWRADAERAKKLAELQEAFDGTEISAFLPIEDDLRRFRVTGFDVGREKVTLEVTPERKR